MSAPTQTLPTRFHLQAALAWSADGDGPKRFTMRAYDGGLLRLPNVPLPVVVDLAGMAPAGQVKALLHHDAKRPVGHMDRVDIAHEITTEGLLSVPGGADEIAAAQRNGFEWEASIGATMGAPFERVQPGQTVSVNGREFQGPILVARKTTLREVSFVGVGAGEHTSAALAASAVPFEDQPMAQPITPATTETAPETKPAAAPAVDVQALTATIKASLQPEIDAQLQSLKAERDELHRERLVSSVDRIAAQYGADDAELLKEIKAKASAGEIAENEIELRILRASRGQHRLGQFAPLGGKQGAPAASGVIEAAICLSNGWGESDLGGYFDEKTVNAAIGNQFAGFGLRSLMVEYLKQRGHDVIGGRLTPDDIKAGIGFASSENEIQASFSSLSLPGITSNVARKEILRGYDTMRRAVTRIARRTSTSDYKPFYMYRLNTSGLFQQIAPDGEFQSIELTEDSYTSRVYPWGRKLAITEVMFRNDDGGAFADLARLFGVAAIRTLEKQGMTTLLSSQSTFWTTGKGNRIASGAGSALSLTSLDEAYTLFLEMENSAEEPIGIDPKFLLTGPSDAVTNRNIHNSLIVNLATPTTGSLVEKPNQNPFQGMFEPLVSPYLASGKVTNATGTQWLLGADPMITAPLVVAYLDGRDTPQIRRWDAIPGHLGMQWDVSLGFGFNLHDDKASVFSPGA